MLMDKLDRYSEKFGEGFPMIPVAWGRSDAEVEQIIDNCIEQNKTAYDLGYLRQAKQGEKY